MLKTYFYIGLAIVILLSGSWIYSLWQDYQALRFEHQIILQNQQAYKDSLTVIAGKETILVSQVQDLTSENQGLKEEKAALIIKVSILIDSIKNSGGSTAIITDSSVRVTFTGKKSIVNFTGWTLANLIIPDSSKWDLSLFFDPVETKAVLYKDDELWKLKTISLTEGIRVKGISILDDDTFAALQKYEPPVQSKNLGFNVQANTRDIWGGLIIKYNNQWYFNANYRIVNQQPKWIDNALVGVSYFLF